jgi:hypothetical protein
VEVLRKEDVNTSRYRSKQVLYFTDNMVSYDIARRGSSKNPSLHALVQELKLLDLIMHGCSTVVIHIPGLVMIQQGTNGLSRGIWRSPLAIDHTFDLRVLFAPVPNTTDTFQWACEVAGIPTQDRRSSWWTRLEDYSDWTDDALIGRWGFWTVRPSLGRQAMVAAIKAWVECPLSTASTSSSSPASSNVLLAAPTKKCSFSGSMTLSRSPPLRRTSDSPLFWFSISPHFAGASPPSQLPTRTVWSYLPSVKCPVGLRSRLPMCAGCAKPLGSSRGPIFIRCFWRHGFVSEDVVFPACNVRYHAGCIRVAPPLPVPFP